MNFLIQPIQIHVSSVIDAPLSTVWPVLRDFNALPQWHPAIAHSRIEESHNWAMVGCVRVLTLHGGEKVREQLLGLSDTGHRLTYNIVGSDVGLLDYVAEIALLPITDGDRTYISWSANFRTEPDLAEEKASMVKNDVFMGGIQALKSKFGRK